MNVLVIGSGGREHAFVWKFAQSPCAQRVFAVPGNAGMAAQAECQAISVTPPFSELIRFARENDVDMTVVGPEAPLVAGIVDSFEAAGLCIFGPTQAAAQLEGSKDFAKRMMAKCRIPTAQSETFDDPGAARAYVRRVGAPIVVKADGLAAGKGVIVCDTPNEALSAVDMMMVERRFGDAGRRVVVEECLVGEEASFMVVCDGTTAVPMASSQDHKRAYDGDAGPNTGGMGAYSPAPVVDEALADRIMTEIVMPLMKGMAEEGLPYRGILYVGVMVTESGPKVLEFNCRFGDPEAQVLLPRLATDLVPILVAATKGTLHQVEMLWRPEPCVCVVMASSGYPEQYATGYPIRGIERANARPDTVVFHAGTALKAGETVTSGGRVLGVTALGENIRRAIENAYAAVGEIAFDGAQFRRDIGHRALRRIVS
ncbi:MAG: phosphoribosylamine--glycine ligase [Nanoarchaeota archaeon]|nr:phosphoribosylamine--glycine ligase [Nanoarchaeota archaeon]